MNQMITLRIIYFTALPKTCRCSSISKLWQVKEQHNKYIKKIKQFSLGKEIFVAYKNHVIYFIFLEI